MSADYWERISEEFWEDLAEEYARSEKIVDLDPHRTVTHLANGVPHCYMGHAECYDAHSAERLSDNVDCEEMD